MRLTSSSPYSRPGSNLSARCARTACLRSRAAGIVSSRPFRKNAASSGGPSNVARRTSLPFGRCIRATIRDVPLSRPERIAIVEVAPRDGLQAEDRTLSTDVKLELLEKLADAGHTSIEATSFVSPKAVPQLADAEDLIRRLKPRAGIRYTTLVPNEIGLERAMSCGVRDIAVFASASESYSRKNLNRSRDEAIAAYGPVIKKAKDAALRMRGYLSMVFADPWDGPRDGRRPRQARHNFTLARRAARTRSSRTCVASRQVTVTSDLGHRIAPPRRARLDASRAR